MPRIPDLTTLAVPEILGAAALTARAFAGGELSALAVEVERLSDSAARLHDRALLATLGFQPHLAADLQQQALRQSRLFRVGRAPPDCLRVLAFLQPGNLMANTPLDFMLQEQDVRLDLLYHLPGEALPARLPDHDMAIFALADTGPAVCAELQHLFDHWPRPALNAPCLAAGLGRDVLPSRLAGIASICSPPARRVARAELTDWLLAGGPVLARPLSSHAGQGLARIGTSAERIAYLARSDAATFFVTPYVDYRDADGLFRKYRVAFIEGRAFLCHMAISAGWMIHYLNAGMAEDATKRAEESRAMADFDAGFARRHAGAFAALYAAVGLDYFSIDCAELADGRLLVFEADNAAIIHMMDPPDLYPYKRPQMRRVFAAFRAMLDRRCRRAPPAGGNLPHRASAA